MRILTHYLKVDTEIAGKTYNRYLESQTFSLRGEINLKGVKEVMKVMAGTGQIDESLYDPSKYCDFTFTY